jgi:hypothetical protein
MDVSVAGVPGSGASWTGPAVCFCAAGFLAVATAGVAAAAGRGSGNRAFAAGWGDCGGRGTDEDAAAPGSGPMMLTAGVEAAEGKSALVGLPVGVAGASTAVGAAATAAGAFHNGA